ncbi:MAG: hypothetical protein ACTSPY_11930 [Candidatus Helarchaeota archaeon]
MKFNSNKLEEFWAILENYFKKSPKKLEVIQLLLKLGFSIKDNLKIYCGNVEIPYKSIAEALEIDRRSVISAIERIFPPQNIKANLNDIELNNLQTIQNVLSNIKSVGIFFQGENIIEITAVSKEPGIIADITQLIANEGISIRQILATDPDLDPSPKLLIITNKEVPGELISKILSFNGVLTAKLIKNPLRKNLK